MRGKTFVSGFPRRQIDLKNGAAAGSVPKADRTAEPHNDAAHDAQAKPGPSLVTRLRGISARKLFRNAVPKGGRNARSVIAHGDAHAAAERADGNGDLGTGRRKLDRVRQQVGKDLRQPVGVGAHIDGGGRNGLQFEGDAGADGVTAARLDGLLDERAHDHPLDDKDGVPRFHSGDVEKIVDQPDQPLAVLLRNREQARRRIGERTGGTAGKQAERAGDRGQGRAQFMAHSEDEVVFELLLAFSRAEIDNQLDDKDTMDGSDRLEVQFDREFDAVLSQSDQVTTARRRSRLLDMERPMAGMVVAKPISAPGGLRSGRRFRPCSSQKAVRFRCWPRRPSRLARPKSCSMDTHRGRSVGSSDRLRRDVGMKCAKARARTLLPPAAKVVTSPKRKTDWLLACREGIIYRLSCIYGQRTTITI